MRYDFILLSKPFSINACYYSDARTKTTEVRQWAAQIFHQLNTPENLEKMKQIRETFDDSRHAITVETCAIYPRSKFITEAGILSSRTIDLTNWEKVLTDLFFDKQYFDKQHPYGVKNINVNDKHIVELKSSKKFHESEDHILEYSITIIPRPF